MEKKLVGGQAVIEGVMMRCGDKIATAIRKDGKIKVKKEGFHSVGERYPILKKPFLRGVVNLIEQLIIGIRTLEYSAEEASQEEKVGKGTLTLSIIVAFIFGIGIFVGLPYLFTYLLGIKEQQHAFLFNLMDGIIRLGILMLYIFLIGLNQDIKILFQYHGAEHKAVACHEHGKELTTRNCRKYSTKHTRCGTSFLMFVILVGVVLFSFVPLIVGAIYPDIKLTMPILRYLILFLSRLLLLPIVAGIAYELLRLGARFENNIIVQCLIFPGLLIQKLTTRQPTDKQVEVAIAALKAVI